MRPRPRDQKLVIRMRTECSVRRPRSRLRDSYLAMRSANTGSEPDAAIPHVRIRERETHIFTSTRKMDIGAISSLMFWPLTSRGGSSPIAFGFALLYS